MSTSDEHQSRTEEIHPDVGQGERDAVIYCLFCLVRETDAFAEKIKKQVIQSGFKSLEKLPETVYEELCMELGDMLWYTTRLANKFGFTLDEISSAHLAKLSSRKKREVLEGSGDNR